MPVASETLQAAGQYGPSIWFAVFVILTIVSSAVLYIKYVATPSRLATEENNGKLTEVVTQLAEVVSRTDARTAATHDHVNEVRQVVSALAVAKMSEIQAISKVAQSVSVDVQSELSEIRGVMKFVQHEYGGHPKPDSLLKPVA